ncbi:unnamed protein product [Penicillium salamii]|uniref:Copper homeostasis protein cutC homolog n=1 Tax=Penicillium salamii TaxID=1612424 RepID=A0A9W4K0M6_9EURO|nr:unnamed protein product [Penicillium salamii]CAG8126448.1 unnamed protein product [Penicillium salamii]CAG8150646.1 unnamed protein product [Penicillium salamii]CAG8156783.1 unnamed protein product [Penicillium salamii]CAG8159695.1 unnamed protein product [Penicillium salamii]
MTETPTPAEALLEIACFDERSAILAASAGADRIELCKDYHSGGLSPDDTVLQTLKSELTIPVYVMIRPHADSFCYESSEFEVMKDTLAVLKSHGADGFVFGILNRGDQRTGTCTPPSAWIDIPRNQELVRLADGRPCTFHRAFDLIPESQWESALADITECGFSSILTNGGPSGNTAIECVEKLAALVDWKNSQLANNPPGRGKRVPEIIVGGGVRASNIQRLREATSASAFHSAALLVPDEIVSEAEIKGMKAHLREPGNTTSAIRD